MATNTIRVLSCSLKIYGIKPDLMAMIIIIITIVIIFIIIIIPDLRANPLHIKHQQQKHFNSPTVFPLVGYNRNTQKYNGNLKTFSVMSVLRIIFRPFK